jgi:PAS domain S-box-containing protein
VADTAAHPRALDVAAPGLPAAHYAAIVESSEDAILSKDREGLITSWNRGAERIYGYTAAEAIGRPISILIPAHRAGEEFEILDRVLAGERVDHYEAERLTKDGRMIAVSLTISPIRDESGEIVSASVIARDVSAERAAHDMASRLHALTAALSKEPSPARAIEVLLEQAVGGLGADAGAVGLVDRQAGEVELAGSIGYSEEDLAGWERFPLEAEVPMSVAIRSGEAVCTPTAGELVARFPALAGADLRFGALAVIPLSGEHGAFGALSLSFGRERELDGREQAFLVAAGQQAAQALERARLYEAEREASARLGFLAEAGELLSQSLDSDTTMARFADLAVRHLCDWCGVELLDEEGELQNVAVAHIDPERVRLARELRSRYPADSEADEGVPKVVRTGRSQLHQHVSDEMIVAAARDEEHLRLLRELGIASGMVVPLRSRARVLGAVTFVSSDPGRRYGQADLRLAEDLARRAALAIDNAALFRREHEAAVTLQRSLLPPALPDVAGARLAARYEPAAPGLEVGGDWYEVVALDDGTIGATIGDVAGRGILAASVMGRVRPALRAYVLDGYRPAAAIARLDRLMREAERPEMTTVFHLHFDPRAGSAEYVRAGHPPALLRRPDGEVVRLAGGGTPPLGIFSDGRYRPHHVELAPGSLLLLYTDGLVERRGVGLEPGLERLEGVFAEAPASPEECLDFLVAELDAEELADDVAMLALLAEPAS